MRELLVSVLKGFNFLVRKFSAFTHYVRFAVQWYPKPRPEWFDHYLDQHWQWSATSNSLWIERGVFSRLVMKPNSKMLEICCGDGFNARHFYSSQASSIIALDFDKDAIPHAKRYNSAPNVTYVLQDIRKGLPAGPFDNLVWDAAIEHFTEAEIDQIMGQLVERLGSDGILSGYTLTEAADGKIQYQWPAQCSLLQGRYDHLSPRTREARRDCYKLRHPHPLLHGDPSPICGRIPLNCERGNQRSTWSI